MARIEAVADAILREVGMDFRGNDDALGLWHEAGAELEGRTRPLPRWIAAISSQDGSPGAFIQHARNPVRSLRMIGGNSVILLARLRVSVRAGSRLGRPALWDARPFRELREAAPTRFPWLHHSGGTVCEPIDIPVKKRHLC